MSSKTKNTNTNNAPDTAPNEALAASDRVSDAAYAIVSYFTTAAPDGLGWNNAPSPLNVQALIDGGIDRERIVNEYVHYVDDLNGGDSFKAFEGNLHDRGQAVVQHLLKGVPYDVDGTSGTARDGGEADRIFAKAGAGFTEDQKIRALQKLFASEPV